jgi:hypothetical protein
LAEFKQVTSDRDDPAGLNFKRLPSVEEIRVNAERHLRLLCPDARILSLTFHPTQVEIVYCIGFSQAKFNLARPNTSKGIADAVLSHADRTWVVGYFKIRGP